MLFRCQAITSFIFSMSRAHGSSNLGARIRRWAPPLAPPLPLDLGAREGGFQSMSSRCGERGALSLQFLLRSPRGCCHVVAELFPWFLVGEFGGFCCGLAALLSRSGSGGFALDVPSVGGVGRRSRVDAASRCVTIPCHAVGSPSRRHRSRDRCRISMTYYLRRDQA